MPESQAANALVSWSVPQCPFVIEYAPRVLDDIRLAVTDAFFSLPRGGAEIGGILLGRQQKDRVVILDHATLECEHAFGPSFILSPKDHARLGALVDAAARNGPGTRPVGWYHSHTRSEIFLSDADVEIHQHYFAEPWQVALVLKPHTFQPTRCGFFFREGKGRMQAASSYQEFVLEPMAMRPAAGAAPAQPVALPPLAANWMEPAAEVPEAPPVAVTPREAIPAPPAAEPQAVELTTPMFAQVAPQRPVRAWGLLVVIACGLAMGAAAYQTRGTWLPRARGWMHASSPAPAPSLGLKLLDADGQLQIHWDRNSPAVENAAAAEMVIQDGGAPRAVALDAAHLRTGLLTYGRQSESVDVSLTVIGADGQKLHEATTYLGKLPERRTDENPEATQERDELARKAQKLASDLKAQQARTKRLEKSMQDAQREQQRKRLENQLPDTIR